MATASTSTVTKPGDLRAGATRNTTANYAAANPGAPSRSTVAAWACLLLSEDSQRRAHLEQAAKDAGWDPIPCSSIGEAIQQHRRWKTQLAAVDLGSMSGVSKAAYMQFAGRLISRDRLLVISDEPTNGDGEIWARQAGAWMYLPSPDFGEGLTELFKAAQEIAEKLESDASGNDRKRTVPTSIAKPSNANQ